MSASISVITPSTSLYLEQKDLNSMPKKKKQKTGHNSGVSGELSQAEIWDDSALIRSWNDAVAEYEYYHSIHARGEDVEEVLRQAELAENAEEVAANADHDVTAQVLEGEADSGEGSGLEEGEVDDKENIIKAAPEDPDIPFVASKLVDDRTTQPESQHHELPKTESDSKMPLPKQPGDVLLPAPSSEQTLENIKMAYYWAGYYSGLYDGQTQAETRQ